MAVPNRPPAEPTEGNVDTVQPEQLWSPSVTANYLDMKEKTLANWRALNKGPAYLRVIGRVRYRPEDVRAWAAQQSRGQAVGA